LDEKKKKRWDAIEEKKWYKFQFIGLISPHISSSINNITTILHHISSMRVSENIRWFVLKVVS